MVPGTLRAKEKDSARLPRGKPGPLKCKAPPQHHGHRVLVRPSSFPDRPSSAPKPICQTGRRRLSFVSSRNSALTPYTIPQAQSRVSGRRPPRGSFPFVRYNSHFGRRENTQRIQRAPLHVGLRKVSHLNFDSVPDLRPIACDLPINDKTTTQNRDSTGFPTRYRHRIFTTLTISGWC